MTSKDLSPIRFRIGRLALMFLLMAAGAASLSAMNIRLVWEHDGTFEDGREGCAPSYFDVYMSFDPGFSRAGSYQWIGRTPTKDTTHFDFDIPQDGKTRYFAVKAVDAEGRESDFSNVVGISSARIPIREH